MKIVFAFLNSEEHSSFFITASALVFLSLSPISDLSSFIFFLSAFFIKTIPSLIDFPFLIEGNIKNYFVKRDKIVYFADDFLWRENEDI